jgi:hypothetical protein
MTKRNKANGKREIAPRLASGDPRVAFGHGLPEPVKEGLRAIARNEGKSTSWVMENVIVDYFDLPRPRYLSRTKKGSKR